MSGDLEILLTGHDSYFASGAIRGNYRVLAVVSIWSQADADEVEVRTRKHEVGPRVHLCLR